MTGNILKIIAMISMFIDHAFKIGILPNILIFHIIGRLAFPIFAYLIAEGLFYTKNIKKYFVNMILFAFISEIPFNLLTSGKVIDISSRNVLFTFLAAIAAVFFIRKINFSDKFISGILKIFTIISFGLIVLILETDYSFLGYFLVLIFYFCKNYNINKFVYISVALLTFSFASVALGAPEQLFCVFCEIPLFLYNGHYS